VEEKQAWKICPAEICELQQEKVVGWVVVIFGHPMKRVMATQPLWGGKASVEDMPG